MCKRYLIYQAFILKAYRTGSPSAGYTRFLPLFVSGIITFANSLVIKLPTMQHHFWWA